jgi:hypothetical protein
MPHPREPFEGAVENQPRGTAARVCEEADAAGVALAAQVLDGSWVHAEAPFKECESSACCCDLAGGGGGNEAPASAVR